MRLNAFVKRALHMSAPIGARQKRVNDVFQPGVPAFKVPPVAATCVREPCPCPPQGVPAAVLAKHAQAWSKAEVDAAHTQHGLMTWVAHDKSSPAAIRVAKAEGCYLYDTDGRKILDFNSQAMCSNLGHTVPAKVIAAINEQLTTVAYAYPGATVVEIRARLCKLLSEIFPGDINTFMFPSSGSEANETAIRMARLKTGRHKILSRYRSYHGATSGTIAMTGDYRRWPAEAGATGFVKFMDPYPYGFAWGKTEAEITQQNLNYVSEVIDMEGGHTVAAIFVEAVTGTNGVLPPPRGYLEGLRALCDKHGILLVCDEVMSGFGRTGKLFGFCHAPSVIPDIVTFAKGVNGAFLPLGGVGMRDHVAAHFRANNVAIGSTYNSHPVALASAYAALQYFFEQDILGNVQRLEPVMRTHLNTLLAAHPSVKQARNVGLFSCIDLQRNTDGDFLGKVTEPTPALMALKKSLLDKGLFTMMRGHNLFCNPPLIITEAELDLGFGIVGAALYELDAALGLAPSRKQ